MSFGDDTLEPVSVPEVKKETIKFYARQIPLLDSINNAQQVCEETSGHQIVISSKDVLSCIQCGAMWLK